VPRAISEFTAVGLRATAFTEAVLGGLGLTSADLESGRLRSVSTLPELHRLPFAFDKSGGQIVLGRQIVGQGDVELKVLRIFSGENVECSLARSSDRLAMSRLARSMWAG